MTDPTKSMEDALGMAVAAPASRAAALFRGGAVGVLIKCVYVLGQFVANVLLARMLGAEGLGVFAFAFAIIQLLVILAQFGMPALLVREISVTAAAGDVARLRGSLNAALVIVAAAGTGISLAWFAWSMLAGEAQRPAAEVSQAALILIPLMALSATVAGAVRGLGYVGPSLVPDEALRPALFLMALAACMALRLPLTPAAALHLYAGAVFCGLLCGARWLWSRLPETGRRAHGAYPVRRMLSLGAPFLLLAGTQVVSYQSDIVILGLLMPETEVGLYRVAVQIGEGVGVALFAISTVIAPHLASLHAQGRIADLQRIVVWAHRIGAILIAPAAVVLALFGAPLIRLVFGDEFEAAAHAVTLLVVGKMLYSTVGFSGLALSMTGHAWRAATLFAATIVVGIALNLILIPQFGVRGAAVANGVSAFLLGGVGCFALYRYFSRGFTAFARLPRPTDT